MNPVQIAAKMYEARDALKSLNAPKFYAKVGEYKDVILKLAQESQCEPMEACLAILKDPNVTAWTQVWLVAALVEIIEPSNVEVAT